MLLFVWLTCLWMEVFSEVNESWVWQTKPIQHGSSHPLYVYESRLGRSENYRATWASLLKTKTYVVYVGSCPGICLVLPSQCWWVSRSRADSKWEWSSQVHSNHMEKAWQSLGSADLGQKAWELSAVAVGLCPAFESRWCGGLEFEGSYSDERWGWIINHPTDSLLSTLSYANLFY